MSASSPSAGRSRLLHRERTALWQSLDPTPGEEQACVATVGLPHLDVSVILVLAPTYLFSPSIAMIFLSTLVPRQSKWVRERRT
jgi:hypothetical protein